MYAQRTRDQYDSRLPIAAQLQLHVQHDRRITPWRHLGGLLCTRMGLWPERLDSR